MKTQTHSSIGRSFLLFIVCMGIGIGLSEYFAPAPAPEVTLEQLQKTARSGADAIGKYLNGPNSGYTPSTYEAPPPKRFTQP